MSHTHPLVKRFGQQRRWCNWYYGKPDKRGHIPKIPTARGKAVDATRPHDDLLTFAEARRADAKHIGIALGECGGEWLSGFDRDDCITGGKLAPDVAAFAEQACTTDDASPSGKGAHYFIVTREQIPTRTDKPNGREFYGAGRFFTFTGKPLAAGRDVRDMSAADAIELVNAFFGSASGTTTTTTTTTTIASGDELADALAFVADQRADDRRDWLRVGMAIKAARGDAGLELWRAFSMRSAKYDADTFARDWQSLRPSRVGIGTIYYMARTDGGWRPPSSARAKTRSLIVQAMHALRRVDMPEHLPVRDERVDIGTIDGAQIVEHRKAINVSRGTVFALADALLAFAWALGHTKGLTLSVRRMADLAAMDKKQAWAAFVAMRRMKWIRQSRGYTRHEDMERAIAFDVLAENIIRAGESQSAGGDISSRIVCVSQHNKTSSTDMSPPADSSHPLPYGRMRMIASRGLWTLLGPTARRICEELDTGEHTPNELIALTHYKDTAVYKALARLAEYCLIESGRDGWALVYDFDLRVNAVCDDTHGKARRTPAQRATARRYRHATESRAFKAIADTWRVERALADEPGAAEAVDAIDGERIDAAILAIGLREFKRTNRARDWRAGVEASTLKREAVEVWRAIHAERKGKGDPKHDDANDWRR